MNTRFRITEQEKIYELISIFTHEETDYSFSFAVDANGKVTFSALTLEIYS